MRPQRSTRSAEDVDADEVAVEEVAVEEVKDEVVKDNKLKLQHHLGVQSTEVPNIQTCQLVSGWGVLYISAGEKVLIFVQNLRHALGRISSLPSQPEIENLKSPVRPLQE